MPKRIYFHLDELGRDAITASAFAQVCEEKGIKVTVGNRHSTDRLLKRFRHAFDVVVIPKIIFAKVFTDLTPEDHPSLVILPSEAVGAAAADPKSALVNIVGKACMEGDHSQADALHHYCLWGEAHLEHMNAFFPQYKERCTIVGNPRHDRRCLGPARKPSPAKTRLGLITRATLLNPHNNQNLVQTVGTFCSNSNKYFFYNEKTGDYLPRFEEGKAIEDFAYTQLVDVRILVELLQNLDPEEYDIQLRVHPREDRTAWKLLLKQNGFQATLVDWKVPYVHWIKQIDAIIGPASTSYYDAKVVETKVLCTDKIVAKRSAHTIVTKVDHDRMMQYIEHPESMSELMKAIANLGNEKRCDGSTAVLSHEANFPASGHALDTLANVCSEAAEHHNPSPFKRLLAILHYPLAEFTLNTLVEWKRVIFSRQVEQGSAFAMTPSNRSFIKNLSKSK
jgi:hypothetical protein